MRPTPRSLRLVLVVSVALAAALGPGGPGAQQGRESEEIPSFEFPPPAYVIGMEDRLAVSVWGEENLSKAVTVRPDGKITLPLVGEVQASGNTPKEVSRIIAERLEEYFNAPQTVTVNVEEINFFKVFMLGEVNSQGPLSLRRPTRILEAISLAGGFTEFAKESNIVLLRYVDGRAVRVEIDYRKIVNGDRPDLNVFLKPGDTIIVN